jgi:hypothetical protein
MTRTVEQVLADQTKEESANELVERRKCDDCAGQTDGGPDASQRGLGDHRQADS